MKNYANGSVFWMTPVNPITLDHLRWGKKGEEFVN